MATKQKKAYHEYPFHTLPSPIVMLSPGEGGRMSVAQLTPDDIRLLRSAYLWLQTYYYFYNNNNSDGGGGGGNNNSEGSSSSMMMTIVLPTSVRGSYSELWYFLRHFMDTLRTMTLDMALMRCHCSEFMLNEHEARYNAAILEKEYYYCNFGFITRHDFSALHQKIKKCCDIEAEMLSSHFSLFDASTPTTAAATAKKKTTKKSKNNTNAKKKKAKKARAHLANSNSNSNC